MMPTEALPSVGYTGGDNPPGCGGSGCDIVHHNPLAHFTGGQNSSVQVNPCAFHPIRNRLGKRGLSPVFIYRTGPNATMRMIAPWVTSCFPVIHSQLLANLP